jgi:hypothetical protein
MKKNLFRYGMLLSLIVLSLPAPQPASADLEWTVRKELDLKAAPLDITPSADGKWIFILMPGEVLVYSISEDSVLKRIPVDEAFDRLMYSARNNTLILTGLTENSLEIIQLEPIHEFDISGLPFKGPEHAPITIAVFGDYQ